MTCVPHYRFAFVTGNTKKTSLKTDIKQRTYIKISKKNFQFLPKNWWGRQQKINNNLYLQCSTNHLCPKILNESVYQNKSFCANKKLDCLRTKTQTTAVPFHNTTSILYGRIKNKINPKTYSQTETTKKLELLNKTGVELSALCSVCESKIINQTTPINYDFLVSGS